jgi:hypothetical protein
VPSFFRPLVEISKTFLLNYFIPTHFVTKQTLYRSLSPSNVSEKEFSFSKNVIRLFFGNGFRKKRVFYLARQNFETRAMIKRVKVVTAESRQN